MTVFLYCGEVGAGKTHGLVEQLRNEVKNKRRIYTNIIINTEKLEQQVGFKPDVIYVTPDQLRDKKTWPVMEPDHTWVQEGLFEVGSAVFIDECQFFLGAECPSIPVEVTRFIDMHRHMTDDQGVPIDLFISSQYRTSLHKEIKRRVNTTFEFKNLEDNGLKGMSVRGKYRTAASYKANFDFEERYTRDKTVYDLYDSTVNGGGSVKNEKASNVGRIKKVILLGVVGTALAASLLVGAIWWLNKSAKTMVGHQDQDKAVAPASKVSANGISAPVAGASTAQSCSGAIYRRDYKLIFVSSNGEEQDVSEKALPDGNLCSVDIGGCHYRISGYCRFKKYAPINGSEGTAQ